MDWAYEMVFAALVGGIVGAKLDFVIQNPGEPFFSGTGLVWFGGAIGGAIGVIAWARWRKLAVWEVCDIAAVPLALGYAIGRIGCQLAGDGDYGIPWDGPWAMSYPDGTVPTTEEVHPTPIYEALAVSAIAYLLWRLRDAFTDGHALRALPRADGHRALPRRVRPPQRRGRPRPHAAAGDQRRDGHRRRLWMIVRARRGELWAPAAPEDSAAQRA